MMSISYLNCMDYNVCNATLPNSFLQLPGDNSPVAPQSSQGRACTKGLAARQALPPTPPLPPGAEGGSTP